MQKETALQISITILMMEFVEQSLIESFQTMIKAIEENKVSIVTVKDMSRFGKDYLKVRQQQVDMYFNFIGNCQVPRKYYNQTHIRLELLQYNFQTILTCPLGTVPSFN